MQQQNFPSNYSNNLNDNDEIDLIEMLVSLWHHKWTVIITTAIFLFASLGYALLTPQVWTSNAVVIKPNTFLIGDYLKSVEKYDALQDKNTTDNQAQNNNRSQAHAKQLFSVFALNLVDQSNQIQFLKTTPMYKALLDKGVSADKAMSMLLDRLTITKPDSKNMPVAVNALDLSFQAPTPEEAQHTLRAFVDFINKQTQVMVRKNTETQGSVRLLAIETEMSNIEHRLKTLQQVRLSNLERALDTAENAGVKELTTTKVYGNLGSSETRLGNLEITADGLYDGPFLFMLGSNYLKAQIETLKDQELVYPQRYYHLKEMAAGLHEMLNAKANVNYQTYSYLDLPSYPESRTKPKRALIVAGGTIAGGFLGVLLALLINAISAFRLREKQKVK